MFSVLRNALAGSLLILTMCSRIRAQNATCDRACLEKVMDNYLTALAAHDTKSFPTASNVRYTENDQVLGLGQGEWMIAGSPGVYRHVFSDPSASQVGAITTMRENGTPVIYIVRLKVGSDGKVSEIETQVTRDAEGAARYENMTAPEAAWLESVPTEQRVSRAKLIEQTNRYYSGMERNDPKGNYSFFDKDCNRLEDGLQTTNMHDGGAYGHSNDTTFASLGCEAQFQTGFLGFVTKIRERHYAVIDEERQALLVITTLDHNGTVRELPEVNGTSSPIPPYFDVPRTLLVAEAFKLRGDKLYRIEMTLTEVPYGQRYAFHTGDAVDLTGAGTEATVADPCDRACLENVTEKVVEAMKAHDASTLPLSKGVQYSENGQFLAIGDGLWETLSEVAVPGKDDYAASFADTDGQTAAYWGLTKEQTTPGAMSLRIKVAEGKITEIEAINVRAESEGERGGTVTLMRPPLPVEWNGSSLGKLDPIFTEDSPDDNYSFNLMVYIQWYLNGWENHSTTDTYTSRNCTRRDNGAQSNMTCAAQLEGHGAHPNGLFNTTTTIRDRRNFVVDSQKAVVITALMIDNPAVGKNLPPTESTPGSYMVLQLFKITEGDVARVESMVKWMPYGYAVAWPPLPQVP
ncbi:hypothetical protein F5Y15DRAFT_371906 [Xylariaceae sp. FL0016]|nr:hypothetical protein F5Y15DRAFT_371906 [Xylariaceae sp. FL0016]